MLINISEWLNSTYAAIITALLAAIGFLVRKVLTNDKEVVALKKQLSNLESGMDEVRKDIKDILFHLANNR